MMIPLAHQGRVISVSWAQVKCLVGIREIPLPLVTPYLQLRDVKDTDDLSHAHDEVKDCLVSLATMWLVGLI
jgi:hypothetical protein